MRAPSSLRAFGRPLALRPVPGCAGLRLWLLDREVDLEAQCQALGDATPPYWAFAWGAGRALARFVLDHPEEVRGARVVDLGAGSGIVAIAAARAGARRVTAVDLDPDALCAARANALANRVDLETSLEVPSACDVMLAADVLYERAPRERLLGRPAPRVLIAEPDRPGRHALDLPPLRAVEVRTFPDVDSPVRSAAVYRLS